MYIHPFSILYGGSKGAELASSFGNMKGANDFSTDLTTDDPEIHALSIIRAYIACLRALNPRMTLVIVVD